MKNKKEYILIKKKNFSSFSNNVQRLEAIDIGAMKKCQKL